MQKCKYSLGLLLSSCISIGVLFKVMHWPGANYLLYIGLSAFVILFLPLMAYDHYKGKTLSKTHIAQAVLGFASVFILGTGTILKISNLTGGSLLLIAGTMLFTFGFLPFLFFGLYKKSLHQQLHPNKLNI